MDTKQYGRLSLGEQIYIWLFIYVLKTKFYLGQSSPEYATGCYFGLLQGLNFLVICHFIILICGIDIQDSFIYLKVPVFSVGKIVTSLGKLVSNPKSEEGWETYNKYVVNTAELEQVKYDKVEIPRAELQELGIDFDALPQRTQRSLMLGLPTKDLFPATVQLSDHGTTTGLFNLSFYRDHNDELKFRLDTPLVQPEYEREEYASEITPDDKVLLMCLAAIHHRTAAQFFGVRANTLAALTGTVAVGAEAALTDNWTVETSAYWNPIRTKRITTQVGAYSSASDTGSTKISSGTFWCCTPPEPITASATVTALMTGGPTVSA